MRPEYYEAIRYRRWAELEFYAKKRPDQLLANTVYELANSIGEKSDRRALKKILWILSQSGIQPHDPASVPTKPKKTVAPKPNRPGWAMIGQVGSERDNRIEIVLCMYRGYTAETILGSLWDAVNYAFYVPIPRVKAANVPGAGRRVFEAGNPERTATIPPEYALYRLARAYQKRKYPEAMKPLTPFWQKVFSEVVEVPHPGRDIKPTFLNSEERFQLLERTELLSELCFSVENEHEIFTDVHALRWHTDMSKREKNKAIAELFWERRKEFIAGATLADLIERVKDVAFILDHNSHPDASALMGVAEDLAMRGANSDLSYWLMHNITRNLEKLLDKDEVEDEALMAMAA